jgi:hypothetical protein
VSDHSSSSIHSVHPASRVRQASKPRTASALRLWFLRALSVAGLALGSITALSAVAPTAARADTPAGISVPIAGPQDTVAKPFEITQDVTCNKAHAQDKATQLAIKP